MTDLSNSEISMQVLSSSRAKLLKIKVDNNEQVEFSEKTVTSLRDLLGENLIVDGDTLLIVRTPSTFKILNKHHISVVSFHPKPDREYSILN